MKQAIEIEKLTKRYGKHRGVEQISLTVAEGDIFGFLGPNGAGKSTTIRSMLGLLRYQDGEIRIFGKKAGKQQKELLSSIGYMPSEAMFYPGMKVSEVIRFAADARRMDCGKEATRICEILEIDKNKKTEELSLGNRKKVSIVCAMQHKPGLLILDEPTSGLDPLMQEAFFDLLLEYNREGTTIFLSSHALSEVRRYCKNAAIIKDGSIIKTDTVEHLSKSNIRRVTISGNGRRETFDFKGSIKELLRQINEMEASVPIDDLLIEEPPLEELFMHYYE